jgi:hypothetical protein
MNVNDKLNTYLDSLYKMDYAERPVSIEEFICSPKFFGSMTECGRVVYPYWMNVMGETSIEDSKYIIALTGSIGNGKTRCATWLAGYTMHRILCLKDPWKFFRKGSGGKFDIVFFNLTKSLSGSRGFNLLQSHLCASEWFRGKGKVSTTSSEPRITFPIFDYKLSSPQAQGFGFIGGDVILALMDEVDNPIASEKQKQKILKAYEQAIRRFEGRFVFDGETVGRFFIISSKQEKLSFLDTYITKMKGKPQVCIKDAAAWNVLPPSNYCGDRFEVSLGDVYVPPKIMYTEEDKEKAVEKGFKIIDVPVEYQDKFETDIVGSLRDFAGVSVSHLRAMKLFGSESTLLKCYDKARPAPTTRSTVEIGLNDDIDIANFVDFTKIDTPRNIPRYIHIDIAFTGDALGLGMSCITGWSKINSLQPDGTFSINRASVAKTDLALRIKAKHGDQIPIHKVQKFIIDLKEIYGFNLELCTFDLRIASISSMQVLQLAGVKCDNLSMDKDPQLYRGFRDVVNEGRWSMYYDDYLHFELSNLDDDHEKNKIDHPDKVQSVVFLKDGGTQEVILSGSKDMADGVAGSVMMAIKNCKRPPDVEMVSRVVKNLTTISMSSAITVSDQIESIISIGAQQGKDVQLGDQRKDRPNRDMEAYRRLMDKLK